MNRTVVPAASLCYVRMSCPDLDAAGRDVLDLLGLEPVRSDPGAKTFRSDGRDHTLALLADGAEAIGIEWPELDRLAERLHAAGVPAREATPQECSNRSVRRALLTQDASGNAIDFVARPGRVARAFYPPHDAGVLGLRAVALRSTDIAGDTAFWTDIVGAEVADWVGDITYLRLDETHHRIALFPSDRSGVLYQSYEVTDLDALMRNLYFLSDRQVEIVQGPGREAASGDWFLRWRIPGGGALFAFVVAGSAYRSARPRQFAPSPGSLCTLGSRCDTIPEFDLSRASPACIGVLS